MTFGGAQRVVVTAFLLLVALALLFASPRMLAQTASGTGTLRGQVTDPSGSSIANATVIVTTPTGNAIPPPPTVKESTRSRTWRRGSTALR